MLDFEQLLEDLTLVQNLARAQMLQGIREEINEEERRVDVIGFWRGYAANGMGLVDYRGKTYECRVLARKCKRYGAKVNLRRTPAGNFVNWD